MNCGVFNQERDEFGHESSRRQRPRSSWRHSIRFRTGSALLSGVATACRIASVVCECTGRSGTHSDRARHVPLSLSRLAAVQGTRHPHVDACSGGWTRGLWVSCFSAGDSRSAAVWPRNADPSASLPRQTQAHTLRRSGEHRRGRHKNRGLHQQCGNVSAAIYQELGRCNLRHRDGCNPDRLLHP